MVSYRQESIDCEAWRGCYRTVILLILSCSDEDSRDFSISLSRVPCAVKSRIYGRLDFWIRWIYFYSSTELSLSFSLSLSLSFFRSSLPQIPSDDNASTLSRAIRKQLKVVKGMLIIYLHQQNYDRDSHSGHKVGYPQAVPGHGPSLFAFTLLQAFKGWRPRVRRRRRSVSLFF